MGEAFNEAVNWVEANAAETECLSVESQQLGHKFGEHLGDLPGYQTPQQYLDLANSIYNDANAIVSSASNGDTLYQVGDNILRVGPNGSFVSLYPSR